MSTEIWVALIGGVVVLLGIVLAQKLSTRAADKVRRGVAYPEFVLAMETFANLALNEPRGTRIIEANAAGGQLVVKLNGVASQKGLNAAMAWLSAGRNVWAAKAIYEVSGEEEKARLPGTWADLQAAVTDLTRCRTAFGTVMAHEIR